MNKWGVIFNFPNGLRCKIAIPFDKTLTIGQVADIVQDGIIRDKQNGHLPGIQIPMISGFVVNQVFYGDFGVHFWDLMSIHHNLWEVFVVEQR